MHNVKACLLSLPSYTKKKKPSATLSFTCLPTHARTHSTFSHTCQIGCQQLISLLPSFLSLHDGDASLRTYSALLGLGGKQGSPLSAPREGREGGRPLLQHTFPLASSPSDLRTQSGTYSRRRGKGIKGVQTLLLLPPPPPLWHQGGEGETGERRGEYPSFPLFSSTFLSSFSLTTTSALGDIALSLSLFSSLGAVVDDEIKDGAVFPLEVAVVLLLLRRRVRIAASCSFLCFPLPTLSPSSSFSAVAYSCLLLLLFPHGFCAASSSSFAGGVPTFLLLLLLLAPRLLPSAQLTTTTNPERAGGGGGE